MRAEVTIPGNLLNRNRATRVLLGLGLSRCDLTTDTDGLKRVLASAVVGVFLLMIQLVSPLITEAGDKKMSGTTSTITILHTNDLHGHLTGWPGWEGPFAGKTLGGADRIATVIKQVRQSVGADHLLVLDAGDTFGDTMLASETKGQAVVEVMNALGYDAMALGNHDPDFSMEVLRERIRQAGFAVLAANMLDAETGQPSIQPSLIREVAGVQIGIVGLAYPQTALTTAEENLRGVTFHSAVDTARRWVPRLRSQGAQVIVALSHAGLGADMALARAVDGIDVIVGGHSHNRIEEPIREGHTLIVHAGAHGSDVGRLDVTISDGRMTTAHHRLVMLDHDIVSSDPAVASLLRTLREPYRDRLEEPLGLATQAIPRSQTLAGPHPRIRDAESPVDSLFADILREKLHVQVVFLPGVGYGVALGPGTVTAEALRNMLPHDSQMVMMMLTGAQLREILEQAVENVVTDDPEKKVGGMIQVSGMMFTYNPAKPYPNRVQSAHVGGQALRSDQVYWVATNSLLAGGGHRYRTFMAGQDRQERGSQYELLREWFSRQSPIEAPAPGRIQVVP